MMVLWIQVWGVKLVLTVEIGRGYGGGPQAGCLHTSNRLPLPESRPINLGADEVIVDS